ncbi:hypothetical protein [Brevundimonas faecalis]|uniref:Uncharacterized protein n=1 Tax=Brevundimonas faecalis TaxID=947378 RepID=A0ABV2R9S7_9CAUL
MAGKVLEDISARLDALELALGRTLARRDPGGARELDDFLRKFGEEILSDVDAQVWEQRSAQAALRICDLLDGRSPGRREGFPLRTVPGAWEGSASSSEAGKSESL